MCDCADVYVYRYAKGLVSVGVAERCSECGALQTHCLELGRNLLWSHPAETAWTCYFFSKPSGLGDARGAEPGLLHSSLLCIYPVPWLPSWLPSLVDLPVIPKFSSCSLPLPACQCYVCSQPSSDISPSTQPVQFESLRRAWGLTLPAILPWSLCVLEIGGFKSPLKRRK